MDDNFPRKQILFSHSPLWSRAPARNGKLKNYSDFMVIMPRLSTMLPSEIERIQQNLSTIFEAFSHVVVYADLNTRLNVLWVSHEPIPGVSRPIIAQILRDIPGAKIVGTGYESLPEKSLPLLPASAKVTHVISVIKTLFFHR